MTSIDTLSVVILLLPSLLSSGSLSRDHYKTWSSFLFLVFFTFFFSKSKLAITQRDSTYQSFWPQTLYHMPLRFSCDSLRLPRIQWLPQLLFPTDFISIDVKHKYITIHSKLDHSFCFTKKKRLHRLWI